MTDPVIFCNSIAPDGRTGRLEGQAASDHVKSDNLAWVHLNADDPGAAAWLKTHVDYMDPVILEALLAENTRPRIEEIDNGVLVILRGINMNDNADPEDMVSLRLWVDSSRVISLERRKIRAVRDLRQKMEHSALVRDAGDVLAHLSSRLFQNMEPFVSLLSEHLDDIEEELAEDANTTKRREIIDVRKKAIIYRRYFAPQNDVMTYLRTSDLAWLDVKHKRQLQENQDRITRYIEDLDAVRERAQIIKDEMASALSEKLNKNLYILSIVTAVFLPLSFLTGLLGINVGGMPGAEMGTAFWLVVALCGALGLLQLLFLKVMRWL